MQSNLLLKRLTNANHRQLLAACDEVNLCVGDILCEPQSPIRYIYFPIDCSISQILPIKPNQNIELACIGSEGMSDTSLVLGVNSSIFQSRVLSSGLALQLSAATFNRKLQQLPKLRQLLNRYVYVQQAQLALTAACNRFHTLDQRLARWLLMTNDRADLSNFHLTHKLLGQILGVRRAGVTESAGNLQEGGIVSYRRGEIRVLSHIALEKASCTCYKASIDIYERVLR